MATNIKSKRNKKVSLLTAITGLAILSSGLGISPAIAASGDVINPLVPQSYRYSSEAASRCIPVKWGSTDHLGQDMAANDGSIIRAAANGTVTKATNPVGSAAGVIVIKHKIDNETVFSAYYHMWKATDYVKVGQIVKKGQTIAKVGSSGPSTAPHLHFEIWKNAYYGNGYSVNPVDYMKKSGVDLKKDAYLVYNYNKPTSCTYFASTKTSIQAAPNSSSKVLKTIYQNKTMTSLPSTSSQSGNYLRVTVDGLTGWAHRSSVSPYKVKQTEPTSPTAPIPTAPIVTTPANVKYVTTSGLNMRSGPSINHSILRSINKGTETTTTGKKSGTWLQVKASGSIGWVSSSYLKAVPVPKPPIISPQAPSKPVPKPPTVKPPTVTTTKVTTSGLNMRTGASTKYKIIQTLPKNAKVTTTGKKSGTWLEVKYGSKTGWVSGSYLKAYKAPSATVTKKATNNLNLRSSSSTKGKVLLVIPKNSKVTILKTSNGWSQVNYGKTTGWASSSYLK